MQTLIALSVATLASLAAQAATPAANTVLKDTRQYDVYIASISGAPDCKMPVAERAGSPEAGECTVKKEHYVFDGELITHNAKTGFCTRSTWLQVDRTRFSHDRFEMPSPSLSMTETIYKCHADGRPLASVE